MPCVRRASELTEYTLSKNVYILNALFKVTCFVLINSLKYYTQPKKGKHLKSFCSIQVECDPGNLGILTLFFLLHLVQCIYSNQISIAES